LDRKKKKKKNTNPTGKEKLLWKGKQSPHLDCFFRNPPYDFVHHCNHAERSARAFTSSYTRCIGVFFEIVS